MAERKWNVLKSDIDLEIKELDAEIHEKKLEIRRLRQKKSDFRRIANTIEGDPNVSDG